jgi:hypothetical protein
VVQSNGRKRCGARVKNPIKRRAHGVAIVRGPFCNAWAMQNGRCRVHGGASTGPKSPEGKARVVAAMVEGRRKWVERRRAEGRRFTAGRKGGEAWVTDAMRDRARAEARKLGAGRFTLDRSLTLALLRSAKDDPAARATAKARLDAQEHAASERHREQALAIVNRLRAEVTARRPDTLRAVGPSASEWRGEAPANSDADDAPARFWRNVDLALDFLGKILRHEIPKDRKLQDMRLGMKVAAATIKAAISIDKNMLKAARDGFPHPLKIPQKF